MLKLKTRERFAVSKLNVLTACCQHDAPSAPPRRCVEFYFRRKRKQKSPTLGGLVAAGSAAWNAGRAVRTSVCLSICPCLGVCVRRRCLARCLCDRIRATDHSATGRGRRHLHSLPNDEISSVFTCVGALGTPPPAGRGPIARKYLPGFPYS